MSKSQSSNKVNFDDYEYNRISFLAHLIGENKSHLNIKYISDNLEFFKNLENKYKSLSNHKNTKFVESYLTQNNDKLNFELLCKNIEFFTIYETYKNKFKHLYGRKRGVEKKMIEDLYFVYLPFSRFLYNKNYYDSYYTSDSKNLSSHPIIAGVQAHQGCGKTTLCSILRFLLEDVYELKTEFLSIDDLYSTYRELEALKKRDKRFKYRGPPGTHDLNLGLQTLENIKNLQTNFTIPRYNKSANKGLGDRAEEGVIVKKPVDIFIFEGWFLGADPVEESVLENYQKDENKLQFQKHINKLLYNYIPLWNYVDYWVVVRPRKYKYSRKWRVEAEKNNKQGMSYKQVNEFVDYFWLTVPPNVHLANIEKKRDPILTITLDKYRNFYI